MCKCPGGDLQAFGAEFDAVRRKTEQAKRNALAEGKKKKEAAEAAIAEEKKKGFLRLPVKCPFLH